MKRAFLIILPLLLIVGYSQNPVDDTTLIDIDGNTYKTVRIGNQIWMAENLKVIHYRNGDPIPNITYKNDWKNTTQGAYCNYLDDEDKVETYGRLYNWFSVNDKRGLAPKGWHIPTNKEWNELVDYLGDNVGGKLKSTGTIENGDGLWLKSNEGATNESGFTALPGGYRDDYYDGSYANMDSIGYFWSSTDGSSAWYRMLYYTHSEIVKINYNFGHGYSVRCVRD